MPPRVFFYAPHPDDEILSMGLALCHFIASGYDVHVVSMSRGGVTAASIKLDGVQAATPKVCGWHGWIHNPEREGYTVPTDAEIGEARIKETRSALGGLSTITPSAGLTQGGLFHHEGGLGIDFGLDEVQGVADCKNIMQEKIDAYPNSLHYTMSQTDRHPDHAACGLALQELKAENPALVNSRFFVSRLYWNYDVYPDVATQPGLSWYGTSSNAFAARKSEYDARLRSRGIVSFSAWNPAGGAWAIGYHQVAGQFASNFGPQATIANLWHS